ncbi:hypothetical protein D3C80_1702620 [compost metagenome]
MANRLMREALTSIRESVREASRLDESVISQAISLPVISRLATATAAMLARVTQREYCCWLKTGFPLARKNLLYPDPGVSLTRKISGMIPDE